MKKFPKADILKRIGGYLIDSIIGLIPFVLLVPCLVVLIFIEGNNGNLSDLGVLTMICGFAFAFLFELGYFVLRDSIPSGSVGRRVTRQELIDVKTGEHVDTTKGFLRNLIFIFLGLIDIVVAIVTEEGKSVSDMIMGTQVVDKPKK